MKKYLIYFPLSTLTVLFPKIVSAHCPLCTVGAGFLAVLAASLGVSSVVVGVMIGAFSLALGLWLSKMVKTKYIPAQDRVLTVIVFLGTVLPIMPLVRDYGPFYISFFGDYGTIFHNTYTINLYVLGFLIGAFIMFASPYISHWITKIRGVQVPFQGISITVIFLVLTSVIIQTMS